MKRLFIDLEKCYECKKCEAGCSYFYHPENKGIIGLLELAARQMVCRKCEEAPCVKACPREALEKGEDGVLRRHVMRCTSCKTCALACPFGAIYPELVPYLVSRCDYCLQQLEAKEPECVISCPHEAIQYKTLKESKGNIYLIGDKLAVHYVPWRKDERAHTK